MAGLARRAPARDLLPTARPPVANATPRPRAARCEAKRSMLVRILTGLVLIPVVVILVWWAPPAILTVAAAIVAVIALLEFFDLGERIGLHGFRTWTIFCTAALFYAQHSLGLEETHNFEGGVSVVRDAAGGT